MLSKFIERLQPRTYLLVVLLLIISTCLYAQDWELVWSDEFDQAGLPDTTKWLFDVDGNAWDWGNNELQNYTPKDKHNAWVVMFDGAYVLSYYKTNEFLSSHLIFSSDIVSFYVGPKELLKNKDKAKL